MEARKEGRDMIWRESGECRERVSEREVEEAEGEIMFASLGDRHVRANASCEAGARSGQERAH